MQTHLDYLYHSQRREFAFAASDLLEYRVWKTAFRSRLSSILGLSERLADELNPHQLYAYDRGDYWEEKYTLAVGEGVQTPLYLLTPKQPPPYQPLLVFHGHEPSAQYCMGIYPDQETAQQNLAIDNNYAQALARAGYLVSVVEQRGFGERQSRVSSENKNSCRHLAFHYLSHGRTLLGERIWDGMCAASFLLSHPQATNKLGCIGHSAGGTTALWLAALDERIRAVLVSGYFNSFHDSILALEHCECNVVPGILALAELGDLAALIAPRPFCALNGRQDPIFPFHAAQSQFETVQRAYDLHNAAGACCLIAHPEGHVYNHQLACKWFTEWLVQNTPTAVPQSRPIPNGDFYE